MSELTIYLFGLVICAIASGLVIGITKYDYHLGEMFALVIVLIFWPMFLFVLGIVGIVVLGKNIWNIFYSSKNPE